MFVLGGACHVGPVGSEKGIVESFVPFHLGLNSGSQAWWQTPSPTEPSFSLAHKSSFNSDAGTAFVARGYSPAGARVAGSRHMHGLGARMSLNLLLSFLDSAFL